MNKTIFFFTALAFFSVGTIKTMERSVEYFEEQTGKQYQADKKKLEKFLQAQKNSQMCSSPQVLFGASQIIGLSSSLVCPENPSTLLKVLDFSARTAVPLCCFFSGKLADKYFSGQIIKLEKKLETQKPKSSVKNSTNEIEKLKKRLFKLEEKLKSE